jgi:hypothetical protein
VTKLNRDRSPEGRFLYLAEKRVDKALTAINSVAKLSDRKNYSYTPEQASQIIGALEESVKSLKDEFLRPSKDAINKFTFK